MHSHVDTEEDAVSQKSMQDDIFTVYNQFEPQPDVRRFQC